MASIVAVRKLPRIMSAGAGIDPPRPPRPGGRGLIRIGNAHAPARSPITASGFRGPGGAGPATKLPAGRAWKTNNPCCPIDNCSWRPLMEFGVKRALAIILTAMSLAPAGAPAGAIAQTLAPSNVRQGGDSVTPASGTAQRTGKERLGEKWKDEQRIDNCKVPLDRRGPKQRPDSCAHLPIGWLNPRGTPRVVADSHLVAVACHPRNARPRCVCGHPPGEMLSCVEAAPIPTASS
jgi:hypothetical protein